MPARPIDPQHVESLLVGAIDPHVHSGPSIAERGVDHLELAREASAAGFAAVVTKDHDYSGVMTAWMITKHHPELRTKVFSSIALNNVIGGFNPYAVEHTAAMGGKTVYMPTLAAENHLEWEKTSGRTHPASTTKIRATTGVPVLNADRTLRDEVKEVIDVIARTGMVLATGHLHVGEIWILVKEARQRGVANIMITHPEDFIQASLDDVRGFAEMGCFIEHSLCMFVEGSSFKRFGDEEMDGYIRAAGVDRTVMASDLGQKGQLSPVDGFRRGIEQLLRLGYEDADIRRMVSLNAAHVLGLEHLVSPRAAAE